MTIMKLIRGIPPELYAELVANDGVCQCGCGRTVDLSQFECTEDQLRAEGCPEDVLDIIRTIQSMAPAAAEPTVPAPDTEFDKAAFEAFKAKMLGGGGDDKVDAVPASETATDPKARYGNYMHLSTGGIYYPLDPRAEEVDIRDIAHSLGMKPRYAGHTIFPFWVAQHSIMTAIFNVPGFNRPEHRLARLMHDASETYNGDLIRPLKYSVDFRKPFERVEVANEAAISARFGLPFPFEAHVKIADEAVTAAEVNQLIVKNAGVDFNKPLHDEKIVAPFKFREWDWREARERFADLFTLLVSDRYINAPDAFFESPEYMAMLNKFQQ